MNKNITLGMDDSIIYFFPADWKDITADNFEPVEVTVTRSVSNMVYTIEVKKYTECDVPAGWRTVSDFDYLVSLWQGTAHTGKLIDSASIVYGNAFSVDVGVGGKAKRINFWYPNDELPVHLCDKIAWALGADPERNRAKSLKDMMFMEIVTNQSPSNEYTMERYTYGRFTASVCRRNSTNEPSRRLSLYHIQGWPTKDEAIEVLNKALEMDGWLFSSRSRIEYVLNKIQG